MAATVVSSATLFFFISARVSRTAGQLRSSAAKRCMAVSRKVVRGSSSGFSTYCSISWLTWVTSSYPASEIRSAVEKAGTWPITFMPSRWRLGGQRRDPAPGSVEL